MKFADIKEKLGNKYSVKQIKKAISKIEPKDFKRKMQTDDKGSNAIIELIKKKLS